MSMKKALKDALYDPVGGTFSQKKKVSVGNIKHSGDEREIFLTKPSVNNGMYSDIDSKLGDDELNSAAISSGGGSFLNSAATTPKAKRISNNLVSSFPIGTISFEMDENMVHLLLLLNISFDKRWIDSKVVKTQVEMPIKKSFALDINLSAVERIIQSTFTSEESMNKAASLTRENKIVMNTNFKKSGVCLDWAIVIKKILINTPKKMIVAAQKTVVEFAKSSQVDQLASKWLFLIRKDLVRVAKAVDDHDIWAFKDQFRVLLFTLPVGTTAYNLGTLLDRTGGKTCIINQLLVTGNRVYCAVVGFESEVELDSAFCTEPIFGVLECDASDVSVPVPSVSFKKNALAKLYVKKNVPISCPAAFGSKFSSSNSGHGFGISSSGALASGLGGGAPSFPFDESPLDACLASLEHSLKLLAKQISGIFRKLSFVELVLMVPFSGAPFLIGSVPVAPVLDLDMALDGVLAFFSPPPSSVELDASLDSSSSKVLTTKVDSLESKILALEASVGSVLVKLDLFNLVWKFAICNVRGINVPVKQKDVVCWHHDSGILVLFIMETKLKSFTRLWIANKFDGVVFVWLLFKGKLLVILLGLYASAFSGARFDQASEVNFFIAKAVNSSTFVVLGGDFNKNRSGRSASFKFCLGLGLVNLFVDHYLAGSYTWSNSRGVVKTIDHIFVSSSLSFAVAGHQVVLVSDFFNTDHRAVMVLVGLNGLLDKFKFKDADSAKWAKFRDLFLIKLLLLGVMFSGAKAHGNMNAMWAMLKEAIIGSADETFLRHWFSEFRCSKNKHFSKFFGLELLVAKIVKKFCSGGLFDINLLVSKWLTLDNAKACTFKDLVSSGVKSEIIVKHLSLVCRDYRRVKMFELRFTEEVSIKKAIERHMKNFCSDKDSMIRSVLDRSFCKVVLNYLVVDDKLVLEPEEIKVNLWAQQYESLSYVRDDAFSNVMHEINMDELLSVIDVCLMAKPLHSDKVVLGCLLVLFNVCLTASVVSVLWKRAWVSMISKPYDWDGVLTNTQPIVLIEIARKILFKVLSDHISVACSKFNILWNDNFSVLKGTSTQFLVFAVGSIVEDALEKNREIWLMCERFIRFFGGIHENRINRIMTDFGLSGGYKVKRHKQLCGYQIDTKFVSKTGRIENGGGLTSYFLAGAFVDDTIWVENCQAFTQYALNIASKFFVINNIFINSEKTVVIPINQGVKIASLSIYGQPISITKKGKAHHYLGIFLLTKGLFKLSVAKAHADVHFFVNVVLKKTVTDKQFSYLVLAVLQLIVSYCIQFSFVLSNVCYKWDALVRKGLRSKTCFLCDFFDVALHHSLLYDLKPFEQMQSEEKVAALIMFSNASGILGHLFSHRFLDLQVLGWASLDPLQFPVRLHVSLVNNFLAGLVKIFLDNELFLVNNLSTVFCSSGHFSLSSVLRESLYFDLVFSLKHFGKRLDLHGPVSCWFTVSFKFLKSQSSSLSDFAGFAVLHGLNILGSEEFFAVRDGLHNMWSGFFEVFMDGSLKNFGSAEVTGGAAAYFLVLDLSVGVAIQDLLSSTMAELQAVALFLECVLFLSTVVLYLDSQAVINACVSEMSLVTSDFRNQCWLKRCHIFNLVRDKDLSVSWIKVKGHSEIPGNVKTDLAVEAASGSPFSLLAGVCEHFLVAESTPVSGNEAGPGFDVVPSVIIVRINWVVTAMVLHPNSHMLAGFTNRKSLTLYTYLIKTVHRRLLVVVRKRLYDRLYSGMLCLLCSNVEFSDHSFTCIHEFGISGEILAKASAHWSVLADIFGSSVSVVLQVLSQCSTDVGLYALICKEFVLDE
ncbi:hypothetical protein G9A89_006707 [Geosiphon pyriformis]|nr:hypothetical protein G9A89_006707 [Geosiphon pyriformis]